MLPTGLEKKKSSLVIPGQSPEQLKAETEVLKYARSITTGQPTKDIGAARHVDD